MWEARSLEEWETEKALYENVPHLETLSELIEARNRPDLINMRKLHAWEAGVDKMGILINVSLEFL